MPNQQQQPTLQDVINLITSVQQELKDDIKSSADTLRAEMTIHFKDVNEKIDSLEKKSDQRHHEVMSHIDGFIAIHNRVDTETVSLRSAYKRISEQLEAIISHSYPQLA